MYASISRADTFSTMLASSVSGFGSAYGLLLNDGAEMVYRSTIAAGVDPEALCFWLD